MRMDNDMFSEYDYNDTLCHYGVKGMKWGVRKEGYWNPKGNKRIIGRIEERGIPATRPSKRTIKKANKVWKKEYNQELDKSYINKHAKIEHLLNGQNDKYWDTIEKWEKDAARKATSSVMKKYGDVPIKGTGSKWVSDAIELEKKKINNPLQKQVEELALRPNRVAYDRAKKENPNFNLQTIYKEAKIPKNTEDTTPYKVAEFNWYKKHGYLDDYEDAVKKYNEMK